MKKNKNRLCLISAVFVIMLFSTLLTGCQLAQEAGNMNATMDKLCGVFITIGFPDLQDYVDTDFSVNRNGELTFNQESWPYKVEGALAENRNTIKFNGLDGYYMGTLEFKDANGNQMSSVLADQGFRDVKLAVNVTDESETHNNEATFCVGPKFRETIYLNPVYQRVDGSYYTTIGQNGLSFSGDAGGSIYSQTLDNSITNTEDGVTTSQKTSYKLNIAVVDEVEKIYIKEMNVDDKLIKTTQYFRDDPFIFVLDNQTKYVIVEEDMKNVLESNYVKRSIYNFEQKDLANGVISHPCNFSEENNIIGLKSIEFVYEK